MSDPVSYFIYWLVDKLPNSPFQAFIPVLEEVQWVMYANWFLPIDNIIAITTAWLTVVSIYYGYRVARWSLGYVVGLIKTLI